MNLSFHGKRDTIKRKIKFVQINIGFHLKSENNKFYSDWIRVKIELIKKNLYEEKNNRCAFNLTFLRKMCEEKHRF